MSSPRSPSLGDIAFMIGCFQGADTHELLQLGDGINKKFVFEPSQQSLAWRGQLPSGLEIPAPIFGIPFEVQRKRASCWILGSNTDHNEVDFKVARNNRHGISKKCLSIDFVTYADKTPILRITNESDNAQLYIQHGESGTSDAIYLAKGDQDNIRFPVIVHHPKFSFRIWPPTRTSQEKAFFISHTQVMAELAISESLEYWPPLDSGLATVDEASRITLDGTVYTKVPNQFMASGFSGTVFIVKRVGGDSVTLCAKELMSKDDRTSSSVFKRQNDEIRKEFESYQKYSHPHLAAAVDIAYMQDGSAPPWLILEHIPFSLADYITRHPVHKPWPEGPLATLDPADIILQLFSFAAHLHGQSAVHRDFSPNNIRLYPDKTRWVVKVIDLGALGSVHRMESLVGTPGFAAPEILNIQPQDEKVDIFSLGMIAFYLLTGRHPEIMAEPLSPEYQVQYICEKVLPHLDKIDDKFRTLLGGLLMYEAKDRWSAQQVINYFWWLSVESDPNYDRKRIASPMASHQNKKRRMSQDASTIRGPRAASEYPPSSTSFETAQEQAQQSQGGLTSVPATPFSEVDFDTEPANDWPLVNESDRPNVNYDSSDDKDWVFTFNFRGWLDQRNYKPYTSPYREQEFAPVSDSGAGIGDFQLGPSWVTSNAAETDALAVDRPRTNCTADVEKLELGGHTCTDGTDSEAETVILSFSSLQSGLGSGSLERPHNRLDADDFHLPLLEQPGNKDQSKGLNNRVSYSTLSEDIALDGVVSFSSSGTNLDEQPASSILSLSSSCHEAWSWDLKERQRAREIEEGNRLTRSFGARPTYPRNDALP